MNDTMAMMPMGMVFHFSSRVPGGLLFSQWRVMSVPGEVEWGGGGGGGGGGVCCSLSGG